MCFIVFAFDHHPRYKLIMAANRDEFYERPTANAHYWPDDERILGGLDLKGGGTWMGVTERGRYGALTNVRNPAAERPDAPTRGALVANYLRGDDTPSDYVDRVERTGDRYNGFNLLVGDLESIFYVSNQHGNTRRLESGIYGLSNDALDVNWPKVQRGKEQFRQILSLEEIDPDVLLTMLRDRTLAEEDELPDTGIDPEWERMLSPIFIHTAAYGTRSSHILLIDYDGQVTFVERTYNAKAHPLGTKQFTFEVLKQPT